MTLGGTTIGESDKGSRKNGNWLRSSTHGSKKAEDEPTKILRSDSDKDKKAQTPVSMIRTESTSKPAENKTTEILSSDSPQVEKPSNLSLIDEQQSTSKPADDRSTIIPASDSHQVKKPESTVSDLKDQQSITKPADEQVTKIESSDSQIVKKPSNLNLIDDQQSITKPADDQVTKILSSDSHQVKKPDSTVNVVNESTPKPPSTTVSDVNAQQSPLKSAHDRSTIITASDSHQDKKSPSIVSVLNEQESTSKPAYNQGTIIPASDSSQKEKPKAVVSKVFVQEPQSKPSENEAIVISERNSNIEQLEKEKFAEQQRLAQQKMKQTVENQELTSKQSESQEELSTDNAGAYPKKDSDDQYYDELFSAQKKIGEELAKLTKQHDEKYEIKKQNATTQQEIDALELERIDTRPEIIFDDDVLPILIENPKTSELKKQWLKKQKEREEEREWARIKEEYEKALKKWLKQYDKQEKRYNETRSDEDYRILKQLELNKPRLYDDEGNEIIDMTTPLQRQEQPISQQQQRSRQQQQRQTILQEQQRVCQNENEKVYINEAKRKRAEIKRIHAMNLKEWQKEYKALRKRFKETGSDEDYNNLEEWRFNKPFLPFDDDDDDDEIINMTQPLRPEMKRQKISLYKKIETKQKSKNISTTATTTTTEISEPENKIPIYSEIAEKIYENGIRYEYYDLKDKREEIYQYWETRLAKVEYLMERDADREEAANLGIEYDHCLACEHKRCEKEKKEELTEMDERIIKAKDIMKDDLKFGNKNEVDLEPLEYRIEPILTNEEKFIVSQAIDQSSEKNEYRSSILKEMIEFERLAKLDISKTKEAILFRDEYFKPLYQDIVDGNFQNDIYKFGLLMDGTYKYYIEKSINESKSEHKGYRAQIMNEINHFSATRNLSESDRKTLTKFLDIFKKRLSDEPDKPEYPISNFRRKVVLGQNPLISAEQEDFLYYASVIRPKIYNEPVDYYVWFLKELYATKGKYFYDPSHNRFSTLETGKTNMHLMNLALESYNNFQKKLPNPSPLLNIMLNTLEITAVPSEEKYSRYSGLPRTSTISSKSSNTGSLSKRMQRSVNQAILQTATQISGNQFTDYSQQL
uniref:Apical junction molecule-like n=1 Tax=Dermatophagoides pteronyssinus TaxID=6956 RepID=A0A6P6XW14_DERPT|nr:apical junction molecule-like [Dermatophagoides pteronyssinus]